jgi:uncharacterized protein
VPMPTPRFAFILLLALTAAAADSGGDLLVAAKKGMTERVRLLIGAKAPLESRDKDGRTPLMLAAEYGHADTVELLLDRGANPAQRDKEGFNAYALALLSSTGGREKVLKLLPQPPHLRVTLEPELSTDNLYSSCLITPQQLSKLVTGLRIDSMVAEAIHDASVAPRAAPVELVTFDADAIVGLHIRPQVSCVVQDSSDHVNLEIDVKMTGKNASAPLLDKTFGGGLKGLHARRATGPAQYSALFAELARSNGAPVYWAVVGALLKSLP